MDAEIANSLTGLVVDGLRNYAGSVAVTGLEAGNAADIASALDAHYEANPADKPSLELVVMAEAEMQGHPAANPRI